MNRGLRSTAVALAGAVVFAAPGTAAYALWSTTATATVQVKLLPPPPSSPPSALACSGGGAAVTLSWSPTAPSETLGYRVYQLDGSGKAIAPSMADLAAPAKSVQLAADDADKGKLAFVVRAYNAGGESADSAAVQVHFQKKKASCS